MGYKIEVTDTFGGEANYDWVNRHEMPEFQTSVPTRQQLVRAAKKLEGWNGVRCDVEDHGDQIVVRPRGLCQIMFINWHD